MEAVKIESMMQPGTDTLVVSFPMTFQVFTRNQTLEEVHFEMKHLIKLSSSQLHVKRDFVLLDLLAETFKPGFDPYKKVKTCHKTG